MTKDERFNAVMMKLKEAPKVEFNIDAISTFCMVSAMRLALQHPRSVGSLRAIVEMISNNLTKTLVTVEPDLKEFLDDLTNEPLDPASQQAISE